MCQNLSESKAKGTLFAQRSSGNVFGSWFSDAIRREFISSHAGCLNVSGTHGLGPMALGPMEGAGLVSNNWVVGPHAAAGRCRSIRLVFFAPSPRKI